MAMDNLISLLKITEKKIMANYTLLFGTQFKRLVTVHGLQLSVHGWKNQRILKFIAKMLIRFRSSLSPYSQQSPGIRAKNRFLV